MTTNEIDINAIKEVFAKVEYLRDRWYDSEKDYSDEIVVKTTSLLNSIYFKLGIALHVLEEPKLKIISAVYGAKDTWKDVKEIIELNIINDVLEFTVNNKTMEKDICPGLVKTLRLTYSLNDETKTIEVKEKVKILIGIETIEKEQ